MCYQVSCITTFSKKKKKVSCITKFQWSFFKRNKNKILMCSRKLRNVIACDCEGFWISNRTKHRVKCNTFFYTVLEILFRKLYAFEMTDSSLANVTETNTISWKLPLTHSILALDFKFQNIHIKKKFPPFVGCHLWLFPILGSCHFLFLKTKQIGKRQLSFINFLSFFLPKKKKNFPFLTFQY